MIMTMMLMVVVSSRSKEAAAVRGAVSSVGPPRVPVIGAFSPRCLTPFPSLSRRELPLLVLEASLLPRRRGAIVTFLDPRRVFPPRPLCVSPCLGMESSAMPCRLRALLTLLIPRLTAPPSHSRYVLRKCVLRAMMKRTRHESQPSHRRESFVLGRESSPLPRRLVAMATLLGPRRMRPPKSPVLAMLRPAAAFVMFLVCMMRRSCLLASSANLAN
jgi:hypothetical protein